MAQNVFSADAWTRARNRFVEDLSDEEQRVFSQASPEAILYDVSAVEKTHQATSTTRGVIGKLQPFVQAVEQYGTALDVYSNIYPLVMGPLWGSVRVVLLLARESQKYFERLADMFNCISDLLPRLRIYEQLFPNHESLVQSISVVYFDVLTFCSDAKKMFRRAKHTMLSLVWKPFERQFGSHMDAFRRHLKEMEKNVSTSHMIEAADSRALIRSNQTELAKERYDQERLQIFASLSTAVDYEAKHRRLRELRYGSTGMWLIRHPAYIQWKDSKTSDGLLVHGIPGSGKSVLTSLVVDDHLEDPNRLSKNALYFYCDYANSPTLQPVHMYRAILQQMFLKGLLNEITVKKVVETVKANVNGLNEQNLVDSICHAAQSCASLHLIIDGLDECERHVQQAIIKTLHRLLRLEGSLIKVFVTSRDEGYLLTKMNDFGKLQISRHAPSNDIESFISYAIASSISSGDLTLRNKALKEEIVSKLVNKAHGMFLWVHFQVADLCDASSDQEIRDILEHLPEGLYDTYTRIFKNIAKTGAKATVLKIMMWMVCTKRPLRIAELQEAVAFDSHDKSWNADKIPDGDKMIKSCHGLVVRDSENENVHLVHHTVQQYLLSPQVREHENLPATDFQDFEEHTTRLHFWPELDRFRYDPKMAEVMAGRLCVTYLCFSDFRTSLTRLQDNNKLDLSSAFKGRGPLSIPAALGLGNRLHNLPYKFFGGNNNIKMPNIDYAKYLNVRPRDRRPSPDLRHKFALLDYVIEYWPRHTHWLRWSNDREIESQLWNLVLHETLSFEFRPWGSDKHFGPYGCKGCPVPGSDDLEPKDLPSMALLHWAAETGHLKVFDMVEPRLQKYLWHERHHDETLLIACRHGQVAVVVVLLAHRSYDLSDGRAILAACTSGNIRLLERLLKWDPSLSALLRSGDQDGDSAESGLREFGHLALYQAASNGHESIVRSLLPQRIMVSIAEATTGLTPLQIAAKNGHIQVVRALLEKLQSGRVLLGRNMDAPHKRTGMKALHYAAVNGYDEIVALLLECGSNCDDIDSMGETALIQAAQHGHVNVVKALLGGGAKPRVRGGELAPSLYRSSGEVGVLDPKPLAIHHAASNGHDNVLATLPYSDWTCGSTEINALHLGAMYGYPNVVQVLLSKGAYIEGKDSRGMRALHYASRYGHDSTVQLLIDRGCEIEQRADNGYAALHFAAASAKVETIKLLVSRGANVIIETGTELETPLHVATQYADVDTIRTLVECGAPLEERPLSGRTALDEAIGRGSSEIIVTLIELGADWNRERVFTQAVRNQETIVMKILLRELSTATAEEQRDAAEFIEIVLEQEKEDGRVTDAWRWLNDWYIVYGLRESGDSVVKFHDFNGPIMEKLRS